jgi:chromosome segregation ATPase
MKPVATRNVSILGCIVLSLLIVGCEGPSKAERENKREQDRAAMQLADAERDRDNYKSQLDAMRANLAQASQKQADAQAQLSRAQSDLATVRSGQAGADQLGAQLRDAQQKLTDSQNRIREMQIQIDALKAQQASATPANPAPTTRPMGDGLNK